MITVFDGYKFVLMRDNKMISVSAKVFKIIIKFYNLFYINIGGEAARMKKKIQSFKNRPVWRDHHNEEILQSLSSTKKQLCNQ